MNDFAQEHAEITEMTNMSAHATAPQTMPPKAQSPHPQRMAADFSFFSPNFTWFQLVSPSFTYFHFPTPGGAALHPTAFPVKIVQLPPKAVPASRPLAEIRGFLPFCILHFAFCISFPTPPGVRRTILPFPPRPLGF
jgi:hypothetical protein